MLGTIAILLRNTTWKCGRMERLVVNHLRRQLRRCGHAQASVKEMLQHFKLSGKQKSEFLEAIKRLERIHIIKTGLIQIPSPPRTYPLSRQGGL